MMAVLAGCDLLDQAATFMSKSDQVRAGHQSSDDKCREGTRLNITVVRKIWAIRKAALL
jgi:hypothetical protein